FQNSNAVSSSTPIPRLSLLHPLPFQPTKNPKKPPHHFQFKPISSHSTTMSSSWSCSKCTFLNPPSQKSTCQICLTPSSSSLSSSSAFQSSSSSPPKWSCKACTFLNSYSRSNCEICDTRAPLSTIQDLDSNDLDNELSGSSSVGSIFFPLRRCNTGQNQEADDLGAKDKVQTQLGTNRYVDRDIQFSGRLNSGSLKRKLHSPVSDNADAGSFFTLKKEESAVVMKGLESPKGAENVAANGTCKRKLCDLGDFIEKPINVDGFREVKSSKKTHSVLDSVNGFEMEKVKTSKTNTGSASAESAENAELKEVSGALKILTYNVWFREDLEVHKRMQAIGDLIQLHSPDIICLQEVTPNIYEILQNSAWWKKYRCSVSYEQAASGIYFCMQLAKLPVKSFSCKQFSYSAMGRELCVAEIEVNQNKSLVVATSHLESPCPGPPTWDQMYSKERVNQAKEAIDFLKKYRNAIFCGDLNWDDKIDGQFPIVEGWFDAWEKLRPADIGWTYDTKSNKMLTANRKLQKRIDRFICCLTDFEVSSIDMIGTEEIPGLSYSKQKKLKNKIQELTLPVLPSDHFGLLLTITNR
ncbi:Tyrosyl-DNA phosphodiesterase 2, partial [Bienertia sinuspersici]